MRARAGIVADPDAEGLHFLRLLLVDLEIAISAPHTPGLLPANSPHRDDTHLVQAYDLTVGLLDLAELGKEVPEPTLRNDIVGSKDAHAVELWCRVGVRGQVTPNDLIFLQATC